MATLKTANFSGSNGSHFSIRLDYSLTQNQAANTSTIEYSLYFITDKYGSGYGSAVNGYINGTNVGSCTSIGTSSTILIGTKKEKIEHNSDGTKSVNYSASMSGVWTGLGSASLSGTLTLPKIDRIPTISSANDFNDEGNGYVVFSNPASLVVKPTLSFYYTSNTTNVLHSITRTTGVSSPYTFTLSDAERTSLRAALKDKKEYTVRYTLKTYNSSGTYIDEVSIDKKFTFVNAEPTFTTSFTETNSKVSSLLGTGVSKIVKDASKIKVTVSPSAKKSATIKSVEIIHGTSDVVKTSSPYEATLTAISNSYKVVVTDSRGYVVSNTITKTLIDYLPIEISQYSFKRVVPTSSDIKLNAIIVYKQQTFNTTANAPTLKWKKDASGTWNTIPSGSYSVNTANNTITIDDLLLSNILPYTQSAKFYLSVSDLLTSDDENATVTVGIPVYDHGERDFQVNGDLFLADRSRQNKAPLNVSGNVSKNLFNAYKYREGNNSSNVHKYNIISPNEIEIFYINGWSRLSVMLTGLEPNSTYTISAYLDKSNFSTSISSGFYYSNSWQDSAFTKNSGYVNFTFTANEEGKFDIQFFGNWSDTNYNGSIVYQNIQLEKGSTATEYEEPFEPTITIRNSNGIFQEIDINEFFNDKYENIKSLVTSTGVISTLEIQEAYVKKSGGMTSLKILAKTSTAIPTSDIGSIIQIPVKYAPSIEYRTFVRTNENYSYPGWNGSSENIAFAYITSTGYIGVRTKVSNQKVICIDLVY